MIIGRNLGFPLAIVSVSSRENSRL